MSGGLLPYPVRGTRRRGGRGYARRRGGNGAPPRRRCGRSGPVPGGRRPLTRRAPRSPRAPVVHPSGADGGPLLGAVPQDQDADLSHRMRTVPTGKRVAAIGAVTVPAVRPCPPGTGDCAGPARRTHCHDADGTVRPPRLVGTTAMRRGSGNRLMVGPALPHEREPPLTGTLWSAAGPVTHAPPPPWRTSSRDEPVGRGLLRRVVGSGTQFDHSMSFSVHNLVTL